MIELANSLLWSLAHGGLTVALIGCGCVAAAFGMYPLVLSIAALFYSERTTGVSPTTRLVVLIPAHDEAALIARCVGSLRDQSYPSALYEIIVIADNCTDETASIAAASGARAMKRVAPDSPGKGQALRWALDRILASESPPDAVLIVDADSIAAPNLLAGLVEKFQAGARAVQGTYLLYPSDPRRPSLSVIAVQLMNSVRPAGFSVLHLPFTQLVGNGMLVSRELLRDHPWTAFTNAEDLEYSLMLQTAGERIAFAGDAIVRAPAAPNAEAADRQRLRWHGGKVHLARIWLPKLLLSAIVRREPSLLGVAFGLALPPLAVLTAGIVTGVVLGTACMALGLIPVWSLAPWLVALVATILSVVIGLRAARAPASWYLALLHAPLYVARMALGVRKVLTFGADKWVRTERESVAPVID